MPVEIERKFLVVSDAWRGQASMCERIRQGYLARTDEFNIRVRIAEGAGYLTIKGRRQGATREEFEYPIPTDDAEALLVKCGEGIEKLRHDVPVGDRTWVVDEFQGRLLGLIIAECELETEEAVLTKPEWAGAEVTNDTSYRNDAL